MSLLTDKPFQNYRIPSIKRFFQKDSNGSQQSKLTLKVRFWHLLVIEQVWSMQFLWSVQFWFKGGPTFCDFLEMPTLKLRNYEKAIKFETNFPHISNRRFQSILILSAFYQTQDILITLQRLETQLCLKTNEGFYK